MLAECVPDNVTVRVDQESLRNPSNLIYPSGNLLSRIEEHRKSEIVLHIEFVHRLPVGIDSDGQHLKFAVLQLGVQLLHFRRFLNARDTPGRPEVQEDHFSLVIAQLDRMPILIFDREVWSHLPDIDDARSSDPRRLFVDEVAGDGYDEEKKDKSLDPLAHS